jgi:hypothetical protein
VPAQGAGQAGVNLLEGTARPLARPWLAQVAVDYHGRWARGCESLARAPVA